MAQASEIKKQYKKRTLFQETWRRLTKNRGAMLGLAFLVLLVLAAALSPVIFNYEKDVIGQNMRLIGLVRMSMAVTYLHVSSTVPVIP